MKYFLNIRQHKIMIFDELKMSNDFYKNKNFAKLYISRWQTSFSLYLYEKFKNITVLFYFEKF